MNRKLTALIVGVADYPNGGKLTNPANDAQDVADALARLGFSMVTTINSTLEDVDRALDSFKDNLNSNDVGLFYFAGHGMQIKGENYLNTIDTSFHDEISAKHSSFPLNQIIEVMDSCSNKTNIIILDACRNNPFVRAWNRGADQNGLASVYTPRGTIIAFATSPGEVAGDGKGKNGCFTEALLKHINTHDIPIEDLFKRVRNTLNAITGGKQTSWEHTSLAGDFYFNISVGRSVAIYNQAAINDSIFALRPKNAIKGAIEALKNSNWYTQNPGLTKLSSQDLKAGSADDLFVLGRNIYQAACGGANVAENFIIEFNDKVAGVTPEKAKNILDGMLFEVFFNKNGEIRDDFKMSRFNDLFSLNRIPEFAASFEFISEVLLNYQNRFYVIPGKSRAVSVDVISSPVDTGEQLISAIHFEGFNILRKVDDGSKEDWGAYPIKHEKLLQTISTEMAIPLTQLTVNINFEKKGSKILWPYGVTVKK
jgi:hypothetical protein